MLRDTDASVRAAAAASLAAFAADGPAREALQRAVDEDGDVDVRVAAASSLFDGRRPSLDEAIRTLAGFLGQIDGHAELAESIAPGKDARVPRLIAALGDEDPRVREAVATTLGAVGPKAESAAAAVAALTPLLRDRDPAVGVAATEALGRLGKTARPAIPGLREAADHADRRLSAFARAVIKRIDPPTSRGD
jgi:HEAT repeat protein